MLGSTVQYGSFLRGARLKFHRVEEVPYDCQFVVDLCCDNLVLGWVNNFPAFEVFAYFFFQVWVVRITSRLVA